MPAVGFRFLGARTLVASAHAIMKPIIAVPATAALVLRAWKKKSLTPAGLVAATVTAVAHAYHPWNLPFVLLCVFFLAGTRVTHIKENVKATLTMHSRGTSGGEGPRTHVQGLETVFANSLMASILTVLHAYQLRARAAAFADPNTPNPEGTMCFSWGGDLLVVGIIANYAAVAADTFSSELGILATSEPRLITSWNLRRVPRGTNGGVTIMGLAAGLFGSMVIVTASMIFLPSCRPETEPTLGGGTPWLLDQRRIFMGFLILWGGLGSVVDSFLGGLFQRSVRDVRSGKIVEGEGGERVLVSAEAKPVAGGSSKRAEAKSAALAGADGKAKDQHGGSAVDDDEDEDKYSIKNKHRKPSFGDQRPSRVVESGWDLLDNNDVNFLMASMMSIGAMAVASWYWGVPIDSVMKP
ncbi:CFEM domain-containing protein [Purpureocillium lavendulum]|uniref:CFEM domain-containing protein n=1 Tax=Purpureocillium lavendulum TaxID=1247861 RepID=A0AB34FNW7_9HYPO|nr:CFEM domain-containing protein [Purpureocillium lavendulum]